MRGSRQSSTGSVDEQQTATGFRPDIQGLRAVAVLLVVAYHASIPGFSGGFVGVDAFFVISGFLITGLLVREVERTGRLSLAQFYARRARRLLPAAATAMVGIAAITIAVLPSTRWDDIAGDLLASTAYVVNWRLAERAVDYLGSQAAPSPAQHFWSLAVEEQFYILWPLLILCLLWVSRRYRGNVRPVLLLGLLVVTVPSLLWSVRLTAEDPGRAYFVTTTRLWELGLGALLVFAVGWCSRWGALARTVVGWSGVLALVASAMLFDSSTSFPGAAALLPTLGAAAVIAAGIAGHGAVLGRMLGARVMQSLGAWSYSWYLWHWPVIVAATAVWGTSTEAPWQVLLGAAAVSLLPAWAAYEWVERPIHERRALALPWRAALVATICVALGITSSVAVSAALREQTGTGAATASAAGSGAQMGAAALGSVPHDRVDAVLATEYDTIVPHPAEAADDIADFDGRSCLAPLNQTDLESCVAGGPEAETVVAIVGDSKMHQWLPAVVEVATRRGWRVETFLMSACPMTMAIAANSDNEPFEQCTGFNKQRVRAIATDPDIDVVLHAQVAQRAYSDDGNKAAAVDRMQQGLLDAWQPILEAGKRVVVLRDNPRPPHEVMECAAQNDGANSACSFEAPERAASTIVAAADEAGLAVVEMNAWICPGGRCPAVVGGVLVYRAGSHLTATYVSTLAPYLEEQLVAAGLP